jgi:hypothetical protein
MPSEELRRSLQADVSKLGSSTLIDVRVRTFRVEFVFLESMTIIVRANKDFRFELKLGEDLYFDPARSIHDLDRESAKFIFLQGM